MKKIMFSDKMGLTDAVLSRTKTQTRRLVSEKLWDAWTEYDDFCHVCAHPGVPTSREYYDEKKFFLDNSPYKVGEVLAVAQSYANAGVDFIPGEDDEFGCYDFPTNQTHGWNNKMFVRADLMPHQIRIANVRVEHLNDISDEDCIKEGVVEGIKRNAEYFQRYYPCQYLKDCATELGWGLTYATPQIAYAILIDSTSGKGTWKSNPIVFVYDFELVK